MQINYLFYYKNKNLGIKSPKDNIKSHNSFSAFFSSTDTSTLEKEGALRNHFLSLIVNNEGKYVAKITRQVKYQISPVSYKTFADKEITLNEESQYLTKVRSYDLIIEKETSSLQNEIDTYNNIIARKSKIPAIKTTTNVYQPSLFDSPSWKRFESIWPEPDDKAVGETALVEGITTEQFAEDLLTLGAGLEAFDSKTLNDYCTLELDTVIYESYPTYRDFQNYLNDKLAVYFDSFDDVKTVRDKAKELLDYLDELPRCSEYLSIIEYVIETDYAG